MENESVGNLGCEKCLEGPADWRIKVPVCATECKKLSPERKRTRMNAFEPPMQDPISDLRGVNPLKIKLHILTF